MKACFYFNDGLLSEESIEEKKNVVCLFVPNHTDRLILRPEKTPCIVSITKVRDKKGDELRVSHSGKEIDNEFIYFPKGEAAISISEIKKDTETIEFSIHIDTLYDSHAESMEKIYRRLKKREEEREKDYLTIKGERDSAVFAYDRAIFEYDRAVYAYDSVISELCDYKNRPVEKLKRKIQRFTDRFLGAVKRKIKG